jgi:hypothetical protein
VPYILTESQRRIWPSGFILPSLMNCARSRGRWARICLHQPLVHVDVVWGAYSGEALRIVGRGNGRGILG